MLFQKMQISQLNSILFKDLRTEMCSKTAFEHKFSHNSSSFRFTYHYLVVFVLVFVASVCTCMAILASGLLCIARSL